MRQRHTRKHLFWRGVVAACSNVGMASGIYPLAPHVAMTVARRRKNRPAPPGHVRALASEWALAVALSAARPVGFLGLPVAVRQRQGPRPVVLVHGYAMNRANFLPLARRLSVAGLGPLVGFEYWTLGKVSTAAKRLAAHIDRIRAHTGHAQVDIVGHSMGGVVGRYLITRGGGAAVVRNLVTLGSPLRGTDVSAVGLGRANSELMPNSSLMQRLDTLPLPAGVRVTAIQSRSDALVSVRSGRVPGVEQIVYDDLGHLGLLASRRVARDIVKRLGER